MASTSGTSCPPDVSSFFSNSKEDDGECIPPRQSVDCVYSTCLAPTQNTHDNASADLTSISLEEPPDLRDGWRSWIVCFASFLIQVLNVGFLHAFGVFFVVFLEEFKWSKAGTAWIGSLAYGLTMAFGMVASPLIIRFGSRPVAVAGTAICSISLMTSSFAPDLKYLYFTFSILYGFGNSLAYTPTMCIADEHFKKYVTVATGIMVSGSSVGTLVLCPTVQVLISNYGWRITMRIFSGLCLLNCASGWALKPLNPLSAPRTPSQRIRSSPARTTMVELQLWKNRVYIIWIVGIFMAMFGYYIPYVHLVSYATEVGISPENGSLVVMFFGASTATGRLMFGKVVNSGVLNRLHMHQLSMFITGAASMLLPMIRSFGGLVAYVVVLGLIDGCYVVLLPVMTATLAGTENRVMAWGFLVTTSSITFTLGPPVAGWIYDATGSYDVAFHIAGVPVILGAVVLFLIPWAQRTAKSTNVMIAAKSVQEPELPVNRFISTTVIPPSPVELGDQLPSAMKLHAGNNGQFPTRHVDFSLDASAPSSMDLNFHDSNSYVIINMDDQSVLHRSRGNSTSEDEACPSAAQTLVRALTILRKHSKSFSEEEGDECQLPPASEWVLDDDDSASHCSLSLDAASQSATAQRKKD